MEPIQPPHDDVPQDARASRSSGWRRAGVWALVIVGLVGVALLIDLGREAAAGEDLVPWQAGLAAGTAAAQEAGKPMLVNFTADWCGPCQQMKRTVFSQPHVAETISEHFVPVKVDMTAPSPGSPEVQAAQRYGVPGFPAYLVLDADGQPVSSRIGQQSETDMLNWLENVR